VPSDHMDKIENSEIEASIRRITSKGHTLECAMGQVYEGRPCRCNKGRAGYRVSNGDPGRTDIPSRRQITHDMVEEVLSRCREHIHYVINRKGDGMFVSPYEALGVIRTELREIEEAIGNRLGQRHIIHELLDVVVPSLIGIISIQHGYEWPPDNGEA